MEKETIKLPPQFENLTMTVSSEKVTNALYNPLRIDQLYGIGENSHLVWDPNEKRPSTVMAMFDGDNITRESSIMQNLEAPVQHNLSHDQLDERLNNIDNKISNIKDDKIRNAVESSFLRVVGEFDSLGQDDKYPTPQKAIDRLIAKRTNQFIETKQNLSQNMTIEYDKNGLRKPDRLVEQSKLFDDQIITLRVLRGLASNVE